MERSVTRWQKLKFKTEVAIAFLAAAVLFAIPTAIAAHLLDFPKIWSLLTLPALLAALYLKDWVIRIWQLNRRGYHSASVGNPRRIVYEEMHVGSKQKLEFPLENTEPGHWEWFVLDDKQWIETVPEWAKTRRTEIVGRMRKAIKQADIHCLDA